MSKSSKVQPAQFDAERYYHRSQRPLQALIFLLPLLVVYELGTVFWSAYGGSNLPPNKAWSILTNMLEWFGATGTHLPALLVVVVLLAWHVARRDPWQFDWRLYVAMFVESFALAIPLLVFGLMVGSERAPLMSPDAYPWQAKIVFSVGAGIYEELVYRLMAIALLHLLLVDGIELKHHTGAIIAIVVSAVLFAIYHFVGIDPREMIRFIWHLVTGGTSGEWVRFFFYTIAGVYLAWLYVLRGFGIVAATHAIYDILIVAIMHGLLPLR